MIRHDILRNPDEVIRTFDFGNDFRDTQCWLQGSQDTLDVLRSLETAHRNYMDQNYRREARETPAGRLLVRYGFEPYDTESSARRVAERAAEEIEGLVKENVRLENLTAQGIHSCHADCQRPMCVLRRERDAAQEEARQWAEGVGTLQRQLEVANAELAAKEKELGSFRTLVCKMTPENIVRTRLAIGYGMSATRCLEVQR